MQSVIVTFFVHTLSFFETIIIVDDNTIERKRTLNIPILYCKSLDYAYYVSLPHGAMPGWPAVCDSGISWPYSIIF